MTEIPDPPLVYSNLIRVSAEDAMWAHLLYGCGYYIDSQGRHYLPVELARQLVPIRGAGT